MLTYGMFLQMLHADWAIVLFLVLISELKNIVRGSEWGGPLVSCRLKFSNFVGSWF